MVAAARFIDPDAPFLREEQGVDIGDRFAGEIGDRALDDRRGHRRGGVFEDVAVIFHYDPAQVPPAQLRLKGADLFRQEEIGPNDIEECRVDRGQVDGVLNRPILEDVEHGPGDLTGHFFLGLPCGGAQVGRADHLLPLQKGMARRGRLLFAHVERCACNVARFDGFEEGGLVHKSAPCAVEDAHARLAFFQSVR